MGRPLGLPKTGGRKKGTPNAKTKELSEKLEALSFDPIQVLASLVMEESSLSAKERADICLELLQYTHPKRKAADVAIEPDSNANEVVYVTSWSTCVPV